MLNIYIIIMEQNIKNAREMLQKDQACVIDWDKVGGWTDQEGNFTSSFTKLGGLDGATDTNTHSNDVYGAEFLPVEMHTPYYERTITQRFDVPWLGQPMEQTFMNRTKELNEPPVQTYKELKMSSIPQQNHESVYDQSVEGFGEKTQNLTFKILCVLFLIMVIYFLMREIKG